MNIDQYSKILFPLLVLMLFLAAPDAAANTIAFQREATTESGTSRMITDLNNIWDDGSPTVMVFREWATQYHISGLNSRQAHISIYQRIMDSHGPADPNPWEKITVNLPVNPEAN